MRLIIFLMITFNAAGQGVVPMSTDRPDQTESPFVTAKGYFQVENGFVYESEKVDDFSTKEFTVNSSLLKYGVSEWFEFRFIVESSFQHVVSEDNFRKQFGVYPIQLGFKVAICEEKKVIPNTSLIVHSGFPNLSSKARKENYLSPNFRFTFQHTLNKTMTLGYNIGAEWNGYDQKFMGIYTIATGFSLPKNWAYYVEFYGFKELNQAFDHRLGTGFTYLLSPNLQFDASAGLSILSATPYHFVGCGISFRFS